MRCIRVLLVDDNPEFLRAASHFLATDAHLDIVGHSYSGGDGLEQATLLQPDLILLDIAMPDMNGLEVARQLKARPDAPRIVLLTLHDSPEYRTVAIQAGADGFVSKSDFGTQLLTLIHALFANEMPRLKKPH